MSLCRFSALWNRLRPADAALFFRHTDDAALASDRLVTAPFDLHYKQLLERLDDAIELLREAGETQFADWLAKDRPRIAQGKTRALHHLMSAYGGAGSINDILFEDGSLNKKFGKLRTEIWQHAEAMLKEIDAPDI